MAVVEMIGYIGFLVTLAIVTSFACAILRGSASRVRSRDLRDRGATRVSTGRYVPTGHAKPGFGLRD
jgi:hypothetical protein